MPTTPTKNGNPWVDVSYQWWIIGVSGIILAFVHLLAGMLHCTEKADRGSKHSSLCTHILALICVIVAICYLLNDQSYACSICPTFSSLGSGVDRSSYFENWYYLLICCIYYFCIMPIVWIVSCCCYCCCMRKDPEIEAMGQAGAYNDGMRGDQPMMNNMNGGYVGQ